MREVFFIIYYEKLLNLNFYLSFRGYDILPNID